VRNTATDVEVAMIAAEKGAAVVRSTYGRALTRHVKGGRDFVTDADLKAEKAILDAIEDARPDDARFGEESGGSGASLAARRWLVDPLCGTENFAAETPLFAVNVALVERSTVLAAVTADPIPRELFWTDGQGAWRRVDAQDEPLHPSAASRLVDINCDGPVDRPFVGPQLIADPRLRHDYGVRVVSSSLAVAWVAAGRRAAYVSDGSFVDNVHFAAGLALCQTAGCVVTDLAGDPLTKGRGLIVAADAQTHARLVDVVRPHLEASLNPFSASE
jgi:myo-inositol-1(or 4)-monophosphatase